MSITEMEKRTYSRYPYITAGKGKGIIEDSSPYELADIIEETDKENTVPKIMDIYTDETVEWDYREFDLYFSNAGFKNRLRAIRRTYEEYE